MKIILFSPRTFQNEETVRLSYEGVKDFDRFVKQYQKHLNGEVYILALKSDWTSEIVKEKIKGNISVEEYSINNTLALLENLLSRILELKKKSEGTTVCIFPEDIMTWMVALMKFKKKPDFSSGIVWK